MAETCETYIYEPEWIECWQCHGEGETEDCFEDTCVCLDPPCLWNPCDVCADKGGWYVDEDTAGDDARPAGEE